MSAFNNLKTSVKLLSAFLLLAVITAVVGAIGVFYINQIDTADTRLYEKNTVPISKLAEIATAFQRTRVNLRDMLLSSNSNEDQTFIQTIQQLDTEIDALNAEYETLIVSPEMRDLYTQYTDAYQEFVGFGEQMITLSLANKDNEALVLMRGDAYASAKEVEAKIDDMVLMKTSQARETADENSALAASATRILIIIVVVAAILAVGLGVVITNSIATPLGALTNMARALSVGDLVRDMSETEKDKIRLRQDEIGLIGQAFDQLINYLQEMGGAAASIADNNLTVSVTPKSLKDELGNAFAKMIAGLQDVIGQVADSANYLSSASEQLSIAASQAGQAVTQIVTTVQQVASGTNQQSVATGRTAKAMEQMSRAIEGVAKGAQEQSKAANTAAQLTNKINESIQQVAGNAGAVTRESGDAANAARSGSRTVEATINGMRNIQSKVGLSAQKVEEMGQRSDQIGMIVETIDDIASQTNLLALNAAIEAARAGEHGKGFAVVADEVRKLAERSSSATKEINALIRGIQKTVSEAVQAMSESAVEVENGVKLANEAGSSLSSILDAAEAVYSQADEAAKGTQRMGVLAEQMVTAADTVSSIIEENTASTEEMSANSSEVTQAIENIAAVSEENSASAQEVSASTEEMSAQVEEVTASAQSLAETAQELQRLVAQFRLDGKTAPVLHTAAVVEKTNGKNGHNGHNGHNGARTVELTSARQAVN
jgi:methyl-accepting chemotaxis protein